MALPPAAPSSPSGGSPPVTVGGATVVADTLPEIPEQQINDAIADVDQLRGIIDELSREITQLGQ